MRVRPRDTVSSKQKMIPASTISMLSCDVLVFNSSATAQQAQQAQQLFLREKGAAIYIYIISIISISGLIQRKYFFSHFCLLRLLRLLRSIQLAKSQSHTANISSELPSVAACDRRNAQHVLFARKSTTNLN